MAAGGSHDVLGDDQDQDRDPVGSAAGGSPRVLGSYQDQEETIRSLMDVPRGPFLG